VLIYFPAKLTKVCRYKDFHLFIFPSANIIVRAKALKLVIAFLRTTLQRYGNFLILPNFTLQSYVKRI
ncbi:hypothetical protein KSW89_13955, partial [Prevotella copri]